MRVESLEAAAEPFITKDGSEIRELAGLPTGNSVNQSLARRRCRRARPPRPTSTV